PDALHQPAPSYHKSRSFRRRRASDPARLVAPPFLSTSPTPATTKEEETHNKQGSPPRSTTTAKFSHAPHPPLRLHRPQQRTPTNRALPQTKQTHRHPRFRRHGQNRPGPRSRRLAHPH